MTRSEGNQCRRYPERGRRQIPDRGHDQDKLMASGEIRDGFAQRIAHRGEESGSAFRWPHVIARTTLAAPQYTSGFVRDQGHRAGLASVYSQIEFAHPTFRELLSQRLVLRVAEGIERARSAARLACNADLAPEVNHLVRE